MSDPITFRHSTNTLFQVDERILLLFFVARDSVHNRWKTNRDIMAN
jgi:hypothetical protein